MLFRPMKVEKQNELFFRIKPKKSFYSLTQKNKKQTVIAAIFKLFKTSCTPLKLSQS
mgnify:CR=1 FL=1